MGCEIPKVIEFRALPENVQDDLMRAEILPTMWPRYRISGYERLFHYRLMTVMRRAMIYKATCHSLSPGAADNMYPRSVDREHRDWINALVHTSGGPSEPVDQLVFAAFECAVEILNDAGSFVTGVDKFNAYQLDLFLFKDMGIGGILAKFIGRMNDPDIGGYEGFSLPEPVLTWYRSFYTDYMTYLDIAGRDAVLAAQVASPGTQVTIQFIAVAIEEAENKAQANGQTLHEFLENRTIADLVEQFTTDENHSWLTSHDFFMGNNGQFTVVREVSETSHDIMMGDTISSDASAMDVDSHGQPDDDGSGQPATLEEPAAVAQPAAEETQPGDSLGSTGLSGSSSSAPRTLLGAEAPPGLLAIEDIKPDEYYQASDQIREALQDLPEQIQQSEESRLANWVHTH